MPAVQHGAMGLAALGLRDPKLTNAFQEQPLNQTGRLEQPVLCVETTPAPLPGRDLLSRSLELTSLERPQETLAAFLSPMPLVVALFPRPISLLSHHVRGEFWMPTGVHTLSKGARVSKDPMMSGRGARLHRFPQLRQEGAGINCTASRQDFGS